MASRIREENLSAIEDVVNPYPEGRTAQQISEAISAPPPRRTLQYRLKSLVDSNRLVMEGTGRWARYRVPQDMQITTGISSEEPMAAARVQFLPSLSKAAAEIRNYVRQLPAARQPTGYDRDFLDLYLPNESFYLSSAQREQLKEAGTPRIPEQPAGTYARQILNRLLIDLSWNSSRLEGNTYSLLDTTRLLEIGAQAEGKGQRDAQMILNHKDAIEFLVDGAQDVGFNRHTIMNLHALLADNLLFDPEAPGRLRHTLVGIEGSVFEPLGVPQLVEECFDQILATASAVRDPFEQAFFVLVQLPYLQPFDDVNKRVSRLAANIPLVKANLSPLSFEDVPTDLYTEAILGVYELRRVDLLRDLFVWACERSAARYAAVRQSLGEPDPFRMRHRAALRQVVGEVVRGAMDKRQAIGHLDAWTQQRVAEQEREQFRQMVERELLSLHERNFARYRIRPSEFAAWQEAWSR